MGPRPGPRGRSPGGRTAIDGGRWTNALALSELATEEIELLPSRETLALFNLANVTASNLALAINSGLFGSSANAWAEQTVVVLQG